MGSAHRITAWVPHSVRGLQETDNGTGNQQPNKPASAECGLPSERNVQPPTPSYAGVFFVRRAHRLSILGGIFTNKGGFRVCVCGWVDGEYSLLTPLNIWLLNIALKNLLYATRTPTKLRFLAKEQARCRGRHKAGKKRAKECTDFKSTNRSIPARALF